MWHGWRWPTGAERMAAARERAGAWPGSEGFLPGFDELVDVSARMRRRADGLAASGTLDGRRRAATLRRRATRYESSIIEVVGMLDAMREAVPA